MAGKKLKAKNILKYCKMPKDTTVMPHLLSLLRRQRPNQKATAVVVINKTLLCDMASTDGKLENSCSLLNLRS